MPVAADLGDHTSPYGSVHIRDKGTVGTRLGLGGLAVGYGDKSVYWRGPVAHSAAVAAEKSGGTTGAAPSVVVTFTDTGAAGLEVKNSTVGWELCVFGANAKNANCTVNDVDGWSAATVTASTPSTVTVTGSRSMNAKTGAEASGTTDTAAVGVRYAWSGFPCEYKQCSVYAKTEALPASPFLLYTE